MAGTARLRVGLSLVFVITLAVLAGPWVAGPGPAADPVHGAMKPPGALLWTVTDTSGRSWTSTDLERTGNSVLLASGRVRVAAEDVAEVRSGRSWLGTDRFGRDVLRQLLIGGRTTLAVASLGTLVALLLGGAVGMTAGAAGGWLDGALMRVVDALLAFPMLLFLVLASAVLEPGPGTLLVLLGATSWMGLARLVRGQILALRERPFVLAARLCGTPWHRMWRWHYLPSVRGPVSQDLALRLGELILAESTLSYLGLGMPASHPTWGWMVADGLRVMLDAWWLAAVPGLAIVSVVVGLALIGDGLTTSGDTAEAVQRGAVV